MRIGLFTDTYFPQISGVAVSIRTLKAELEKLGNTVYVFTPAQNFPKQKVADTEKNIVRLRSIPSGLVAERRLALQSGLATATKIAVKYKLDLVHTQTEFGVGLLGKQVAAMSRIPHVHTLHTKYEDYLHFIPGGSRVPKETIRYLVRAYLIGAEGLIVPSVVTEEAAIRYGVKCPIRIIPTGIDVAKFFVTENTAAETKQLRAELGIEPNEKMLLSVSRLSEEKNIGATLRAVSRLAKESPIKLVIVGDGPGRKDLEKVVRKLGIANKVIFTGMIPNDEVKKYFRAADCFISASRSETQGLTFLESLAARTPVIAADNPIMRPIINEPEFGRLFTNDDDIAAAITSVLTADQQMTDTQYLGKLMEISSDSFGKRVLEFYQYIIKEAALLGYSKD